MAGQEPEVFVTTTEELWEILKKDLTGQSVWNLLGSLPVDEQTKFWDLAREHIFKPGLDRFFADLKAGVVNEVNRPWVEAMERLRDNVENYIDHQLILYAALREVLPRKDERNEEIHRLKTEENIQKWGEIRRRLRATHPEWITIKKTGEIVSAASLKICYLRWKKDKDAAEEE